jgi:hypothetical protein
MKLSPPLAAIVAALTYLAGVAGVVLEGLNVGALPTQERVAITVISGILVGVGHWHAASVTAARAAVARRTVSVPVVAPTSLP